MISQKNEIQITFNILNLKMCSIGVQPAGLLRSDRFSASPSHMPGDTGATLQTEWFQAGTEDSEIVPGDDGHSHVFEHPGATFKVRMATCPCFLAHVIFSKLVYSETLRAKALP